MNKEDIIRMAREAGSIPIHERPKELAVVGNENIERFAALVAAHVRETEFKPDWNSYQQGRADGAAAEREKFAAWMIQRGYATGHGDTTEDLLRELDWQVLASWSSAMKTGAENEREACAAICDRFQARDVGMQPAECAGAIRARGQA